MDGIRFAEGFSDSEFSWQAFYLAEMFVIIPLLHRYSFWRINNRQLFITIVGKGEIACNKQFLLFPKCFLLNQVIVSPFVHIFDIISVFAAELERPKIGMWGKVINLQNHSFLTFLQWKHLQFYKIFKIGSNWHTKQIYVGNKKMLVIDI